MPALIDETTGVPAFIYNQQRGEPWHKVGTPVDGAMTGDELFERCPALGFEVEKRPLYAGKSAVKVRVPGWSATVRKDTNAPLGVVADSYHVYQNREAVAVAESFVAESGAHFDTAGSLYGGKLVFAQMALDDDKFWVPGDPSPFVRRLLASWGHDGRSALNFRRTQTRVVCSNTHAQAVNGAIAVFSVRHTAGMLDRVSPEEVQRVLGLAQKNDAAFEAAMVDLTRQRLTLEDVTAFTQALIPIADDGEKHVRLDNARQMIADLYAASPTLDGVDRNAYRLFQATVEYADHFRTYTSGKGSKDEARAVAVLDGAASSLKDRALSLLLPVGSNN